MERIDGVFILKIHRFFIDQSLQTGEELELNLEMSHRLNKVLRFTLGDQLILFNGNGYEYKSEIQSIHRHKINVNILERLENNRESPLIIHLGQVLSKGEKMDFVIQKATELGVNKITPLFSARSMVHLAKERLENKVDHLQKIAIHAAEQCGRTIVPTIANPLSVQEWILNRSENTRLLLHPSATHSLVAMKIVEPVALLIGAEGGFTEAETKHALTQGFKAIRLGPRILRTETATLAVITAIQYQSGDLAK